jgi:tetratricopeptide (TPR) repeat protein
MDWRIAVRFAIVLSIVLLWGSTSQANGYWFWSWSSARWYGPGLIAVQQASYYRVNFGASGFISSFRYGAIVPAYGVYWRGPWCYSPWGIGVPGLAMVVPSNSPFLPVNAVAAVANQQQHASPGHLPGLTPIFPPSNARKRAERSPREQADLKVEAAREALAADLLGLAREHLQTARALDPDSLIIKLLLGQTLLMQGKYHAAAEVLRNVWTEDGLLLPEMRGALTGIANSKAYREALDRLESLRVRFPDDPELLFLEAQGRTLAGHDALARPHWKRLANHPPDRIVAGRVLVQHHD